MSSPSALLATGSSQGDAPDAFWCAVISRDKTAAAQAARGLDIPLVEIPTYSFDTEEGEGGIRSTTGAYSLSGVPPGTPKTVLDAWNQDKEVKLMMVEGGVHCGARIGDGDNYFQACALPQGE